jgi:site-specific recombinase XerD
MKVNFFLKGNSKKKYSIDIFFSFGNSRASMATGYFITMDMWEYSKQRVKLDFKEEAKVINPALFDLETKARDFNEKYSPATPAILKSLLLGVEIKPNKNENEFFAFFENYKDTAVPKKSIHNYNKCLIHLKSFSDKVYKVSWETLTKKFYHDYVRFLSEVYVNNQSGKTGILNSTIGKDMWVIKNVCSYAGKHGIIIPADVEDFSKPPVDSTRRHFITEERLNHLLAFDFNDWTLFSKHLRMQKIIESKIIPNILKVRDIYTFDFYTALAHKETMKIIPPQVVKAAIGERQITVIDFSRTKTKRRNSIPLNKKCEEIIEKYKGGKTVLPYFVNSQYNRICKKMFELAGFTKEITITRWSGDKEIVETFKEWQLLTSHTGRHSAATNILNKTGDLTLARDLLGHSSVKTTEIYAKNITETFNAKILKVIDPT